MAPPFVMHLHLLLWNMQYVFFSFERLRNRQPLCLRLCLASTLCPAACVRWLSLYILNEVSLAQLSLSCIIPPVTSSLLYPSAQGLGSVFVCVCRGAYVKACNCNPHPATLDQVFSVTSAVPRGKGWSCMCVSVCMFHWWLRLSLKTDELYFKGSDSMNIQILS